MKVKYLFFALLNLAICDCTFGQYDESAVRGMWEHLDFRQMDIKEIIGFPRVRVWRQNFRIPILGWVALQAFGSFAWLA